ncbi:MAG: ParB/RepB/Spo0J family partition protein [bacterium]|nr:ParB/RepB/Spo0J family partition protein [bacterium]
MLGKGLESLIPKKQNIQSPQQGQQIDSNEKPAEGADAFRAATPVNKPAAKDAIFYIETEKIKPNPHQPRRDFNEESLKELANSIREHGILQPLIVSKIEKETEFGTKVEYQLIAGERRLRASQIAGLESVPVIIKNIVKDAEHLEMAIVENLQRADLNPVETARAYAKLQDVFGLTQREVAQRLGKSRETIANTLRLLNLPTEIQEAVAKNQINESQARLLLTIGDQIQQQNLFNEIISNNLSVRELRQRIRKTSPVIASASEAISPIVNPEILNFQEQLTELLGAKVKIKPFGNAQGKGGEIIIDFYSAEEIEGIIKKLSPENNLE